MASRRQVVVVGAGIGGLMSALALNRHGIDVVVVERDLAPPAGVAPEDSMVWLRKGVPQSLHPHFFMGRLRLLLERRYPDLVARLFAAGVGENALSDYIHPDVAGRYHPRVGDEQLKSLNARRTTFEMTVRDYVAALPGVEIRDSARAVGLLVQAERKPLEVEGVIVETPTGTFELRADAVIDASGRFGKLTEELVERGVEMRVDQRDSGIWYLTRHYRLNPGCAFPKTSGLPGVTFPDFIVGALPADNGAFTVTFQVYREDKAIVKALRDPAHFQAMAMAIHAIAAWVDPANATPTSEIYGFAAMDSFWRNTVVDGRPQVLGFFCVGDSCVRSNPKFGRGCTWTTVAAHRLADLLAAEVTPAERAVRYEAMLEREFRTDWQTMRQIDRATERAFEVASGRRRATLRDRLSRRFEEIVATALVTEPDVFREVWAGYHGMRGMKDWARQPAVWLRLVRAWSTPHGHAGVRAGLRARPTRQQLEAAMGG